MGPSVEEQAKLLRAQDHRNRLRRGYVVTEWQIDDILQTNEPQEDIKWVIDDEADTHEESLANKIRPLGNASGQGWQARGQGLACHTGRGRVKAEQVLTLMKTTRTRY